MGISIEGVQYLSELNAMYNRKVSKILDTIKVTQVENASSAVFAFEDRDVKGASVGREYTSPSVPRNSLNLITVTVPLDRIDSSYSMSDLHEKRSQVGGGSSREALLKATVDDYNLKIEDKIIAAMSAGFTSTPSNTPSANARDLFDKGFTILKNSYAEEDICLLASSAFMTALSSDTQFSSSDYVDVRRFNGNEEMSRFVTFRGVKIYEISGSVLPQTTAGSSDERLFMYAKGAICAGMTNPDKFINGSDARNADITTRMSGDFGALVAQASGGVQLRFDGSAHSAKATIV